MTNLRFKRSCLSVAVAFSIGTIPAGFANNTGLPDPFYGLTYHDALDVDNTATGSELWIVNDDRFSASEGYGLFIHNNGGINLKDNGNREDNINYNNIFLLTTPDRNGAAIILGDKTGTGSPYLNADSTGIYSDAHGILVNNGNLTLTNSHISAKENAIVIDNSAGTQSIVNLSDLTIAPSQDDFNYILDEYYNGHKGPVTVPDSRTGIEIQGNNAADISKRTTVTGNNINILTRYLALNVAGGAQADFKNMTIRTEKNDQPSVSVSGENTLLTLSDSTIDTVSTGVSVWGNNTPQSAKAVISNSVINRNSSRFGLTAREGGVIEANNTDINLKAGPAGSAGFSFSAVAVRDKGSLATLNDVRINDVIAGGTPARMVGIYADSDAQVDADKVVLISNSDQGDGIRLYGQDTTVNLKNSRFDITGKNAAAASMMAGKLNIDSSLVKATDFVFRFSNLEDQDLNAISVKNSELVTDKILIAGGENVKLDFTADNSRLSGQIRSQGMPMTGGHSVVNLSNQSEWVFGGFSVMNELHTDNSLVRMLKPVGNTFNRLEVDKLTGKNGVIELWTEFTGDTAGTDTIIINEAADGQTGLRFRKAGGEGEKTTNGILIVDAVDNSEFGGPKATTTTDAFHIDSGSDGYRQGYNSIVAGAYEYKLTRGADKSKNENNWYLTSLKKEDETKPPVITPPVITPEVSMFFANAQAAREIQRHKWQDRTGQGRRNDNAPLTWARIVADSASFNDEYGNKRKTNKQLLHFGSDLYRHTFTNNSSVSLGAMALLGKASNKITSMKRDAKGDVNSYNIGAYATWQQDPQSGNGAWADSWLMHGWNRNEVSGSGLTADKYNSRELSLSLEAGYTQPVYEAENHRWVVQPQAQVIWSTSSTDDITRKSAKDKVTADDSSQFTLRAGVRLAGNIKAENGTVWQPFTELNYRRNPDGTEMQFGRDRVKDKTPRSAVELGLGLQADLSESTTIRAVIQGEKGDMSYSNIGGQLGVTYKW